MISLYSGTPGSGKSLHMASNIRVRLAFHKPVICNFPIATSCVRRYREGDFIYCPNDKLTPDFLIAFSREYFQDKPIREGTIHLYIDECQLLFNCREWDRGNRASWISFFTQHRKFGYDIFLVAQFDRMIDRQLRSLIEYEYIHRKFSNFGIRGAILSLLFGGKMFVAVKMWYPLKERVGADLFRARKRDWQLYDTYADFSETG